MTKPSDNLFLEIAVAKGFLEREQADEALGIQAATAGDGPNRRLLREIVVEEDWMLPDQVAEVDASIEEGSTHTGRIEGYKLLAKVGKGGMGTIYKAVQEKTGEVCALKILPRRMAERPEFVERFLREARSASTVQSEHIVGAIDIGFSGGYHYFAMEYVEGESLDTTLSIDGPMPESKAIPIIYQMAKALRDAAAAGVLHRDIKPGNILLREDGVAKLTDFGLVREVGVGHITSADLTLGTPKYMSPEQARAIRELDTRGGSYAVGQNTAASEFDIRSDIYSLGVTFYNMVTGSVPFQAETSLLTMLKHLNEAPVAPISRRPDLSQGCNDLILKMLRKEREDRYQTPEELMTDLELVAAGHTPIFAMPRPELEETVLQPAAPLHPTFQFADVVRKKRQVMWIKLAVAVGLVALAGFLIHRYFPRDAEPAPPARTGSPRDDVPRQKPEPKPEPERPVVPAPVEAAPTAEEEAAAKELFERAKQLATQPGGDHADAARLLWRIVVDYVHTDFRRQNRDEIERLLVALETEDITVERFFNVQPEPGEDGRSVLRYDFTSVAQARDWPTVWHDALIGRWSAEPTFGEFLAESGRTYFKIPLSGDYGIEITAKDLRTASIRIGVADPSGAEDATGCRWVWRREGGGIVSTITRAGKELAPARELASFSPGATVVFAVDVHDGAVDVRVGDKVLQRVAARAQPFDPNEPGYLVLEDFNLGARVTQIAVSFPLDAEHLEREFVAPLRRARVEEVRWDAARFEPLLHAGHDATRTVTEPDQWTLADSYASARENVNAAVTFGEDGWQDYALCTKVHLGEAAGAARVLVRWADIPRSAQFGRGYYVSITSRRRRTPGRITIGKTTGFSEEPLKEVEMEINREDWHPLCVEVRGNRIRVLLRGEEVCSVEDDTHAAGRVGLASFRCGAQFSDIRIKVLPSF